MKEFMMIFRTKKNDIPPPSPEQMQGMIKVWHDWIGSILPKENLWPQIL
ncbi:MAG: hypothetical protein ACI9IP_000636 [Arcticibacterium sp.]|jgi:hypothetical protein